MLSDYFWRENNNLKHMVPTTSQTRLTVKDRVYADNPQTLDQLKANICDAIVEILPEIR